MGDQQKLKKHIVNSLLKSKIKPFYADFNKIQKSSKGYIYLLAPDAEKKFISLHNSLKSGILVHADNPEMPNYAPHISLAVVEDEKEQDNIIAELKNMKLNCQVFIASISLLTLDKKSAIVKEEPIELYNPEDAESNNKIFAIVYSDNGKFLLVL